MAMKQNECSIIKHSKVKLPNDRVLLVMKVDHVDHEDRSKSWYMNYAKVFTREEVEALQKSLKTMGGGPADHIKLDELGIKGRGDGLLIFYSRINQTHSTFADGFLASLFKKAIEPEEYVEKYVHTGKTPLETELHLMGDESKTIKLASVEDIASADFDGWYEKYIPHKREENGGKNRKRVLPGAEPAAA